MKRMWVILALSCCLAHAEEIAGWRVLTGTWESTSKNKAIVFHGPFGRILFPKSLSNFTLSFKLFLDQFEDDKASFIIIWAMKEGEGEESYERLQFAIKSKLVFVNEGKGADKWEELKRVSFSIPTKRWVTVQMRCKGKGALVQVGSEKFELKELPRSEGYVALSFGGTSGSLRDLKMSE
ncbi:MAG: hypothetical protein AB1696_26980 [Planctomycetota bacterium]